MEQVIAAGAKVPMLFLVGNEDVLFPPEFVQQASQVVPNARFVEVKDAAHSVYFERSSVFNHVVDTFLAETLSRE